MTTDPECAIPANLSDENHHQKNKTRTGNCNMLTTVEDKMQEFNVDFLPVPVKRRIKALKQLQLKTIDIEAEFYEEVHALECKYSQLYAPFYKDRSNIITGAYEPTKEECFWESDEEEEMTNDLKLKVKIDEKDESLSNENKSDPDSKGIPEFWLTIFKNVAMLSAMVQEYDEPILKHLYDINVIFLEKNPMGFILQFHFASNEYFSNSTLTKEYHMKSSPDKDDPFNFEGPEIYKCKGCIIDWKKGKNVTVKTIKKNQKHKSRGSTRTVTKTVQNDSFFNFFSPPIVPDDPDIEKDDETQLLLTSDFEIGHYIRERIVPRAVLYYTGEGLEEDEDYEEDEDDEDMDDDDEDNDDEIDDEDNSCDAVKSGKMQDEASTPADCRQQ